MSFNYDNLVDKSFFTEFNFRGSLKPNIVNDNLIPCLNLKEFHYQTSLYLNLFTSIYIELKKIEIDYDNNIIKFN